MGEDGSGNKMPSPSTSFDPKRPPLEPTYCVLRTSMCPGFWANWPTALIGGSHQVALTLRAAPRHACFTLLPLYAVILPTPVALHRYTLMLHFVNFHTVTLHCCRTLPLTPLYRGICAFTLYCGPDFLTLRYRCESRARGFSLRAAGPARCGGLRPLFVSANVSLVRLCPMRLPS